MMTIVLFHSTINLREPPKPIQRTTTRTPKGSNPPRRRGRGNFTAEHVIARGKMIRNLRALNVWWKRRNEIETNTELESSIGANLQVENLKTRIPITVRTEQPTLLCAHATMAKIIDKIRETLARGDVVTSFEFFPAKTEQVNVTGHCIALSSSLCIALRHTCHAQKLGPRIRWWSRRMVPARTEQA